MTRPLLALVLLAASCAERAMTPSQFTERFVKEARAGWPALGVTAEADLHLRITREDGEESTAFLDNAYQLYLQDPDAAGEVIRNYLQAFAEPAVAEPNLDRTRIVPVVKDRPWMTEVAASAEASGLEGRLEHVFEDLNEDLVIVYAVDHPNRIRFLGPTELGKSGLQRSELRALAIDNLRRILPKPELTEGPLISLITAGGDYDASLLLFPEIWSGGSIQVDGDIVVAVPSRDVLLISGSENAAGMAKLRELATQTMLESPYRLTDRLFVFRDGGFRRFEPTHGR